MSRVTPASNPLTSWRRSKGNLQGTDPRTGGHRPKDVFWRYPLGRSRIFFNPDVDGCALEVVRRYGEPGGGTFGVVCFGLDAFYLSSSRSVSRPVCCGWVQGCSGMVEPLFCTLVCDQVDLLFVGTATVPSGLALAGGDYCSSSGISEFVGRCPPASIVCRVSDHGSVIVGFQTATSPLSVPSMFDHKLQSLGFVRVLRFRLLKAFRFIMIAFPMNSVTTGIEGGIRFVVWYWMRGPSPVSSSLSRCAPQGTAGWISTWLTSTEESRRSPTL